MFINILVSFVFKPSFWSNIELSRRRKGGFIFSSGIGKGKVKKLEEEREQKKRWKAKKAFREWKINPFQAGKDVLDPKCNTNLKCTRSVLDAFKLVTVSDALVDSSLSPIDGLPPSPSISIPFDSSSFKLKDFENIIQTRRNASAPGINMIPYKSIRSVHN